MISVQGRGCCYRKYPSIAPSVAPPDSFPSSELGDKLSDQPTRFLRIKPPIADAPTTTTTVPQYFENNLQQIFKAVLEARTLTSALILTSVISEVLRKKLKAHSLDVYCEKFHMDCYNFCQQCEDYFATAEAMGPTWICFTTSFLWDQISFRWQQYKQKNNVEIFVPVT